MEDAIAPGTAKNVKNHSFILKTHEVLLSVGFAFSFGYGFLYFCLEEFSHFGRGQSALLNYVYIWWRAASRLTDIFHLPDPNINASLPSPGNSLALELGMLVPITCFAALLYFLLKSSSGTSLYKAVVAFAGGGLTLFLLPGFEILAVQLRSDSLTVLVFSIEVLILVVFLLGSRWKRVSLWYSIPLVLIHFVFWGVSPAALNVRLGLHHFYGLRAAPILAAAATIVWLLFLREFVSNPSELMPRRPVHAFGWLGAIAAIAVILLLWGPSRGYALTNARDRRSVEIVLLHSGCFGSCPAYEVKVRGDGEVKYTGRQDVKECGQLSSHLTDSQVEEILRALDKADFFTLEPRAFLWSYDVPGVWITVNADGRTKMVGSKQYPRSSESRVQAQFEEAALKIDEIVESKKWIGSGGYCKDGRQMRPEEK